MANDTTAANHGWGYLHIVEIGTDSVQIAADYDDQRTLGWTDGRRTAADLHLQLAHPVEPGDRCRRLEHRRRDPPDPAVGFVDLQDVHRRPDHGQRWHRTHHRVDRQDGRAERPDHGHRIVVTANAIVPFSSARLNLWNDGYFHNPATAFPGGAALTPGVSLLTGYSSPVTDYVIFRQSDAALSTPFEPGGTQNWVQTLFSGTRPFVDTPGGQALLTASGITPDYVRPG